MSRGRGRGGNRAPAPVETAEVVSLAHDGRGVAKIDGKAIFVAGALPGEQITLQRLRKQRSADEARLVEVLRAAPERVEPPCQHYGLCGGCALQHMESGAQVAAKQQQLLQEQDDKMNKGFGGVWGGIRGMAPGWMLSNLVLCHMRTITSSVSSRRSCASVGRRSASSTTSFTPSPAATSGSL